MIAVSIFFHPHVPSSFTFFFSGVIGVAVIGCVMAVVAFVFVFFHPHEAGCFTVCFVFDVIVGVVVHVVTDAVFVAVFVSMVVMCVSTKHFEDRH